MIIEKPEKIDLQHVISYLREAQNSAVHTQQYPDQNDTVNISIFSTNEDADRPDPLRVPEVIIVISVLLLWCGSIFIFIRHSELLRIRHRDIPYRSILKPPLSLNHIASLNRTSDMTIHTKSRLSSTGGLTPPISNHVVYGYKRGETIETISLTVSPASQKRRHTHSFDFQTSPPMKYFSERNNDQEHLLHPHRISSDIKQHLLDLHRKSVDNVLRKSMENLSTTKYSTFCSANPILKHEHTDDTYQFIEKKRWIQESPV